MRKRVCHWCGLIVGGTVLLAISVLHAAAVPPSAEFLAAKQSFLKEMKKSNPVARAAAVRAFGSVMHPGAAELLLKRGFADEDESVRLATRAALGKLADDSLVNRFLVDELKRSLRKTMATEVSVELLRALLVSNVEDRQSELLTFIDEYLATPKGNLLVPMTVIDDFAEQGTADAVRSVTLLAKASVFETHFGYRRCVVQAMTKIRRPEAVDFLIKLLPKTDGLIQYDVVHYLTALTKQKFRGNDMQWAEWWKANRDSFSFPAADVALVEEEVNEERPTYYRIPICAKRIVFVLDTSGSMRGQPIEAAKQALVKAIDSLPEVVNFDVVMFDIHAATWHPRLVPATEDAKKTASRAVISRGLAMGTASHAALMAAFSLDPEAIYFLSDGEPTDGPPVQIVNAASQLNRTRRVSIHTIGVVTTAHGGEGLTLFMKPLAEQNYGTFQLIE